MLFFSFLNHAILFRMSCLVAKTYSKSSKFLNLDPVMALKSFFVFQAKNLSSSKIKSPSAKVQQALQRAIYVHCFTHTLCVFLNVDGRRDKRNSRVAYQQSKRPQRLSSSSKRPCWTKHYVHVSNEPNKAMRSCASVLSINILSYSQNQYRPSAFRFRSRTVIWKIVILLISQK